MNVRDNPLQVNIVYSNKILFGPEMANAGNRWKTMTSPLQNITKFCQNAGDY